MARQAGKQRGRTKPQRLLFSSSSTGARRKLSQIGGAASSEALTFMRRPEQAPRSPDPGRLPRSPDPGRLHSTRRSGLPPSGPDDIKRWRLSEDEAARRRRRAFGVEPQARELEESADRHLGLQAREVHPEAHVGPAGEREVAARALALDEKAVWLRQDDVREGSRRRGRGGSGRPAPRPAGPRHRRARSRRQEPLGQDDGSRSLAPGGCRGCVVEQAQPPRRPGQRQTTLALGEWRRVALDSKAANRSIGSAGPSSSGERCLTRRT
jgi:hypothetical protein